jgi:hypothetical protein
MNLYGTHIATLPTQVTSTRVTKWGKAIKFRKGTTKADLVAQMGFQFSELCFAVIDQNSNNELSINEPEETLGKDASQLLISACDADTSSSLNVRTTNSLRGLSTRLRDSIFLLY